MWVDVMWLEIAIYQINIAVVDHLCDAIFDP
jgi:hypothetical protein